MRLLNFAAALLLAALPASATVLVTSATVAEEGICIDLRSTGAASITVSVDDGPEYGFVKSHWTADGTESLTIEPLRPGVVARTTDHGRDAQQRLVKTVWVPTKADTALPFRVQVHEGETLVAEYAFADLPAGSVCAAAP